MLWEDLSKCHIIKSICFLFHLCNFNVVALSLSCKPTLYFALKVQSKLQTCFALCFALCTFTAKMQMQLCTFLKVPRYTRCSLVQSTRETLHFHLKLPRRLWNCKAKCKIAIEISRQTIKQVRSVLSNVEITNKIMTKSIGCLFYFMKWNKFFSQSQSNLDKRRQNTNYLQPRPLIRPNNSRWSLHEFWTNKSTKISEYEQMNLFSIFGHPSHVTK